MRERVYAALAWQMPDVVPWVPKSNHVPRDPEALRRLRQMGMGLTVYIKTYAVKTSNVVQEKRIVGDYKITTFHTPVGDVSEKVQMNLPSEGGERSEEWKVERMIKTPEDYKVVKFIVEDQVFIPRYKDTSRKEKELCEDQIVATTNDYSPLMKLIVGYMGFQKLAVEIHRNRSKVEELLEAIDRKLEEQIRVTANSPIKIVEIGDNIDGMLISPAMFEKYCLPYYQKYNKILHAKDKLTMSHMDGRLKSLKNLIAEADFDAIEAFTPPPTGNLPLKEARATWDEKIAIWVNVPEVIFYSEPSEIEQYIKGLLKEAAPGNGLVIGITETVPPTRRDLGLEVITKTIQKYGKCPIEPN